MIDYDGRRFRQVTDASGTDVPEALYRQDGDLIWAEFSGGEVRRGSLTGTCAPDGVLDFAYTMVLRSGAIISGRSRNTPLTLPDGRIRLHEEWERFGPDGSTGISCIEEVGRR